MSNAEQLMSSLDVGAMLPTVGGVQPKQPATAATEQVLTANNKVENMCITYISFRDPIQSMYMITLFE